MDPGSDTQQDYTERIQRTAQGHRSARGRTTGQPQHPGAFEVTDVNQLTEAFVSAGAELLALTQTPWRSLNARLEAPAGLQITLVEELGDDVTSDC